ncbi:Biotin/lipoyl attachment domain-containing protein isoform 2 [Spatholobus suberectus]|nr:Biotin/lipoyl attachment domain-containing protein isoform 2 [Spatholobus suberectus]
MTELAIFHDLLNSFFLDLDNVWFAYDQALVLEVCDETQIAELRVKVGESEMHLKRNVGVTKVPMSNISPTTPPPVPTKPMSSKLAALEASGSNNYVIVSSPTVGSFQRGRTVKGKKQPPICKEGNVIKEGQGIGYLDQFGTSLLVKTDVAGEVLKPLFQDGNFSCPTNPMSLAHLVDLQIPDYALNPPPPGWNIPFHFLFSLAPNGDPPHHKLLVTETLFLLSYLHSRIARKRSMPKANFKRTMCVGKRMAALVAGVFLLCLLACFYYAQNVFNLLADI